jgi:hypothetical protein
MIISNNDIVHFNVPPVSELFENRNIYFEICYKNVIKSNYFVFENIHYSN